MSPLRWLLAALVAALLADADAARSGDAGFCEGAGWELLDQVGAPSRMQRPTDMCHWVCAAAPST